MKTLLTALSVLTLSSTAALAGDGSLTIAAIHNVSDKIEAVTLSEGGRLEVVLRGRHAPIGEQLAQATVQRLTFDASLLADARLTTDHRAVVCMMMINPQFMTELQVAPYNRTTGEWEIGDLKTVLTPSSCAISTYTYPVDRSAFATAAALKEALLTLGTEAYARTVQN
jgi:hypothetical protein